MTMDLREPRWRLCRGKAVGGGVSLPRGYHVAGPDLHDLHHLCNSRRNKSQGSY